MKTLVLIAALMVSCGSDDAKSFGGLLLDAGAGDAGPDGHVGSGGSSSGGAAGGAPGTGGASSTGGSSSGGARATGGATNAGGGPGTGGSSSGGAGGRGGAEVLPCPADEIGFAFNAACTGYPRCHSKCELLGKHFSGCAGGPTGRSCVDSCDQCAP